MPPHIAKVDLGNSDVQPAYKIHMPADIAKLFDRRCHLQPAYKIYMPLATEMP